MRDLAGARVLVTGAAGFLGANLVRALLERGSLVTAIVRLGGARSRLASVQSEIEILEADVADAASVEAAVSKSRPDLAVNLVVSHVHPTTTEERLDQLEVSVLGTARLLESLAGHDCVRLVHVGSSLEYGAKSGPMSEDDVLAPFVPRGAAKAAATLVCLAWARSLQMSAVVLRPFSVYGPWEDETRLVPTAFRAAHEGTELELTEPGIVHDYVYVGDVVEAIRLGLISTDTVSGQILNVGTGVQTTNEDLVATIGRVVGREIRMRPGKHPSRPHDTGSWVSGVDRARRVLGWAPSTTLEEGLRATAAWRSGRQSALGSPA